MTFSPKTSAPQSNQIQFLQVARLTETASGELHQFGGSQAPLDEMRSQPGEYAEGGFFVDTHPDPASRRTRKSDLRVGAVLQRHRPVGSIAGNLRQQNGV